MWDDGEAQEVQAWPAHSLDKSGHHFQKACMCLVSVAPASSHKHQTQSHDICMCMHACIHVHTSTLSLLVPFMHACSNCLVFGKKDKKQ